MRSSRKRLLSVLFDSGASFEQENAYRRWPVSFRTLRRIASACRDKGTTWSQPVFILAAGTVQRSASQSTSLHSISLTMPGRRNVGNHLPIQVAKGIVTVALDIGIVADLLTDAAHSVAGFQLSLGFI